MKKTKAILIFAVLTAAAGCSLFEEKQMLETKRSDADKGYKKDPVETVRHDSTVYVTGIEYPEGYKWQKDTAYGKVERHLVVFANGKRILRLPVGEEHRLSPDPDMHRIVDGHLYSDFSTEDKTYVARDGETLFSFSGREMMCGFLVRKDTVYTLGRNRSGKGLSLRKNGEVLFKSDEGVPVGDTYDSAYPTGALYEDNGTLCFAYYIKYKSAYGDYRDWYVYRNGRAEELKLHSDVKEVFDARVHGGEICVVTTMERVEAQPVLFVGDERYVMGYSGAWGVRNFKIVPGGTTLAVKGETLYNRGRSVCCSLLRLNGESTYLDEYARVYDFYLDGEDWGYVMSRYDDLIACFCHNGKKTICEGYMHLMSIHCATLFEGEMYAALTPFREGINPSIWKDGDEKELQFNGCLTGIYIERN